MSRSAESAVVPAVPQPQSAQGMAPEILPHHQSHEPKQVPYDEPYRDDAVTRDEMMKLFGRALRVR